MVQEPACHLLQVSFKGFVAVVIVVCVILNFGAFGNGAFRLCCFLLRCERDLSTSE